MTSPRTSLGREVVTLAPAALVLLALLEVATSYGARHGELALAAVVVVVAHVLPGAVIWRCVRPERGWLVEDLAMGLAIGLAMSVPSHALAVAVGLVPLGGGLPVVAAAVALAVPRSRRRVLSRRIEPLPWAWGAAVAGTVLIPVLTLLENFALPVRFRGWGLQYVDMPYHTALVGAVSEQFPPHYPQVALERLTYHWFTHAWTAQVSTLSGTTADILLWRFNPALLSIAVPLVTAVAAMRICGRAWAGPAAAAVGLLLLDVVPWGPAEMASPLGSPLSPSQQFGTLLLVALVTLVALRWRGDTSRAGLPLLVLMLLVVGGAKGSTLPVVVAGMLLATGALVLVRGRPRMRVVALDTVLAAGMLLALNRLMFGGGDGGVTLDYGEDFATGRGSTVFGTAVEYPSALGVLALVLGVTTFLLGVVAALGLLLERRTRTDPVVWLLLGGGIAGLGARVALTHPGSSQGYFYKSGELLLAIAATWGAMVLWERAAERRRLLVVGAVAGPLALGLTLLLLNRPGPPGVGGSLLALLLLLGLVAAVAFGAARLTRTGHRGLLATAAVALLAAGAVSTIQVAARWDMPAPSPTDKRTPNAIHAADVRALRWLGEHSERGDLVVTNKHCLGRVADRCDRRRFYVGAYTGRGVLVEGWTYNRRAAGLYAEHGPALFTEDLFWDPELMALNDGFVTEPSADAAEELWDLGARWVVVWRDAPHAHDLAPYAERVRRSRTLDVYRLARPGS